MCRSLPVAQFYVADLSYPCCAGCDCHAIAVAVHSHSPKQFSTKVGKNVERQRKREKVRKENEKGQGEKGAVIKSDCGFVSQWQMENKWKKGQLSGVYAETFLSKSPEKWNSL